ncbi:transglycosylase domain-containing protein [Granulicella tundricola]|uniref:peptidoglycan glycosyltransferase n=1 Tax=Granulicella tundricola (strain ATCC BAA-1859 / DSM 23138 / MP5ACTX9) TaxID=1198114 RepID=E8X3K2_GRATM|nr:transglycosylase domain-containing protein [Granulicella tundricola]ADW68193.1 Peptidoglycan glycosyltransferase [Granulicella tundricola MP5ACTX9]
MPVKLKIGPNAPKIGFFSHIFRFLVVVVLFVVLIGIAVFAYYYHDYQRIVDERLAAGPLFASVAQIYAAPKEIRPGQHLSAENIAYDLRAAGYNVNQQLGTYDLRGSSIFIKPGPQSYHSPDGATITTSGGEVTSITAENGATLRAYQLEPLLITALSEDKNRTKRRLVTFDEIPPRLIQAVTAIEDRRFFEHGGVNYFRMAECAIQDFTSHAKECGGSTLTMQLSRGFFLTPEKKYSRKLREIMITFQLENRFSKQQIFEMYANQINLGQRGSFAINGFGEAAQAFFGKDLSRLDTAQYALLAGTIQSPNRLNPYRHPDRVMERRNVVLDSMVKTGALTQDEAEAAKAEGLHLAPANVDASEAPYFVDLVHEQLVQRLGDNLGAQSLRIYTSLDPDLQRAASDAVEAGMRNVDAMVSKRGGGTYPQVALVALDPHTGQILAMVGGRNYGTSQLDHATSMRPTGSIFKPFVYATAFNTSLSGTSLDGNGPFTAVTRINDDPQDFGLNGQSYVPGNFEKGEYPGMVTAADALAHSLNIATIALAHKVGYENVAALARSSGIASAKATPSVAIGTYSATPIDMAGAYTVFANNGVHLTPWTLASVRNNSGDIVADFAPVASQVLDARVAYLTQSLMQGVMARGTAATVHKYGFNSPAAGKTGTSHDAWFAGYTSNLICIIWVGNDDYTDVKLQGALAAAPIWAEFMNRAIRLPQYSDVHEFTKPEGVTNIGIDRASGLPADSSCPAAYTVAFLDSTIPAGSCSRMSDSHQSIVDLLNGTTTPVQPGQPEPQPTSPANPNDPYAPPPPKKKNFFKRLFGAGNQQQQQEPPPPQ